MSLLKEAYTTCVMVDRATKPDGEGGFNISWVEGAEFQAAIVFENSMQARVAEKQGVSSLYTVTTDKNVHLEYHDVFKRKSDGKVFRVTSDSEDKATPNSATFQVVQVSAEEFTLPR